METEIYLNLKETWPNEGRHILASYDDQFIFVYQAYKPTLAKSITETRSFHAEECLASGYSMNRMSWIKPNFLWMMYRLNSNEVFH